MSPRRLRMDQALGALPDSDELAPLREALIGASRDDAGRAWAASEAYATLDTRLADTAALEAQVAALAERVRERTEAVLRHTVRALRALEAGDPGGAARALVAAGEAEEADGRLDEAELHFRRALELGRKPRDRRAEGLALRRLGRVAAARGEFARAAGLYRRGWDVAEAQRDREGMVVACQGMGNAAVYEGRWEDAVEWYARGVALLEGAPPSRDLWLLESNLSVAERRAGRLERSAEWLERAERTAAALDDGEARLYVENARGMLLAARGDHAGAEAAFRRALEGGGTPSLRGSVLTNLADALLAGGRAAEAERVLRELELLAVARGLAPVLPYVYRGLGAVARARGDAEGFLFYEQALELCRRPGSPPVELAATQHEYARFEEAVGQTESARERLREALEIYARLGAAAETARAGEDLERLEETLSTDDPA
ncbi:MAG TPA: hypothetical protein VF615_05960 [Longimicrobiaceae bacterium]